MHALLSKDFNLQRERHLNGCLFRFLLPMNELNEIQDLINKASEQTQKLTAPLVNNAIFISAEIDKLREYLKVNGWTRGSQMSGEAKAYNTLMGTFNTTIKSLYYILNDKMPEQQSKSKNKTFEKIRNEKQTR